MTRERFETEIVSDGRPVVLRALTTIWPLVEAGRTSPQAVMDRLSRYDAGAPLNVFRGPPEIGGRFGYSPDLKGFNHERLSMPFADFADELLALTEVERPPSLYAGGVPVPSHFPGLLAETPMPLLEAGRERLTSLWLGNQTITAAHWDLAQNLACVVAGRRRFTLFPPEQVRNLYVGPLDNTLAGQPISLVDFDNPDLDSHPRFVEAMQHALVADVEPGDVIYIPSLWWHHVRSLEDFGALVNFWWRDGPDYMVTPMFTLWHAMLTIRDLPANEREAWRSFFDHYVFQTGGDPMTHIPVDAQGLMGPMTREIGARLKALLVAQLSRAGH